MEIKKLFREFKRKLLLEAVGKAILFAATCSGCALFAVSFIYHIIIEETPSILLWGVGTLTFMAGFFLVFIRNYPSEKKIAKRLDELGLQERIGTMLQFENQESEILKLQRKDAMEHLSRVNKEQLGWRFTRREVIACIVSVCMAVIMLAMPYNLFDFSNDTELSEEDREKIIAELIDELREEVEESNLPEEIKEQLLERIEKLEEELSETDSELEQIAIIEKAKREMNELLEKAAEENPELKEEIEKLQEELEDTFDDKKEEILGNAKGEKVEEPEQTEENEEGQADGEQSPQDGQEPQDEGAGGGQNMQGQGGGEATGMTEGIYDPSMGNVPYGEVFAMYYAEYLDALEKGEVPEELQKIMDQYYSSLE